MPGRTLSWTVLGLGVVLALSAIAEFWVGLKAEHVSDLVRPEMTDSGLARHRADFALMRGVLVGLDQEVIPAIATGLNTTPARLRATIDANYPAVAKLLAEQGQIIPFAESSLANLERQQQRFENADSYPISSWPGYSFAFVDFAFAVVIIGAGVELVVRGRWRIATLSALIAVCALLIVLPLSLRAPAKTSDAQTVLDSLNPTEAVVARTEASIATANAAAAELEQRLLPDLAKSLGVSRAEFDAAIARQSPATGTGLKELANALGRYNDRLAIRVGGAEDIRALKKLPIARLAWFDPAFGAVLLVIVGGAIVMLRRERDGGRPS